MSEATYTAKDITVLEGLEPVRLRPGMYIGSTGPRGLHHLVYEVVDNSDGKDDTGTTISFLPDAEVFEELELSAETLTQRLRETAFLTRGLRIVLTDERAGGETIEFHYEGGIRDFVAHVNAAKDPIHKRIVYFEGETDQGAVEVAMQWNHSYQDSDYTFANNINTHEGGTHLSGFKAALTGTLNRYARQFG